MRQHRISYLQDGPPSRRRIGHKADVLQAEPPRPRGRVCVERRITISTTGRIKAMREFMLHSAPTTPATRNLIANPMGILIERNERLRRLMLIARTASIESRP
jgi:hypothetical protein